MRVAQLFPIAAAAAALVASLAGCASPPPLALPPTPTETPLFASDDEALAAAVEVYAGYVAAADEVARDGWTDLEPMRDWVTLDRFEVLAGWAAQLAAGGYRREGVVTFDSTRLQSNDVNNRQVAFYLCSDLGASVTFGSDGREVSGSRGIRTPEVAVVEFEGARGRVAAVEPWDGSDYC